MKLNLKNKGMWIDLLNLILSLIIIILATVAILKENGGRETFAVVFALGALMFLLNAAKAYRRDWLRTALFCVLSVFFAASSLFCAGLIGMPK